MSVYILSSDGELYHYGIKGMKWGIRRYQNPDGSLTAAGRKRLYKDVKTVAKKTNGAIGSHAEITKFKDAYASELNEAVTQASEHSYRVIKTAAETGRPVSTNILTTKKYVDELLGKYGDKKVPSDAYGWTTKFAKDYLAQIISNLADKNAKDRLAKEGVFEEAERKRAEKIKSMYDAMTDDERRIVNDVSNTFEQKTWTHNGVEYDMGYKAEFTSKIGDTLGAKIEIRSSRGNETRDSIAAVNFLKRYNYEKASEGVTKEYYDREGSWIDKDPSGDNYLSRSDFKNRIGLDYISIDPNWGTYEAWWDDDGMYGYHSFTDEGSIDDMKVRYRSLNG